MESSNSTPTEKYKLNFPRILASVLVLAFIVFGLAYLMQQTKPATASKIEINKLSYFPVVKPTLKYGFALDTFHVYQSEIKANQFLADILLKHKVDYLSIDKLARKSVDTFNVKNLRANKPYMILSRDSSQAADYFIYEPDVYKYVVYSLKDSMDISVIHRPIESRTETASGIIETSLWNTMMDNGLSMELTARMEDALAWSVDFYHIQKNDKFKLIYDQHYIDGKRVGVGDIHAALYKNKDYDYYAIYYENKKHSGFYDLEARPMKKVFLKSPVKYSRISSRFNKNRFHPILKRRKAHLGTDYAAPTGTPIYAVGNGTVTHKSYTRGNGKYVKIKHDRTYQTQYLHMNGYAKGLYVGKAVKQGEVIGYVGKTGLATGPHVCFRFWKNGRQVNHLKLNFPPPDPMPKSEVPKFNVLRDSMKILLDQIDYKTFEQEGLEETPLDSLDVS